MGRLPPATQRALPLLGSPGHEVPTLGPFHGHVSLSPAAVPGLGTSAQRGSRRCLLYW